MTKPTKKLDLKVIAKRFKVTVRTVRNWRKEAAPLRDLPALRLWLSARKFLTMEVAPAKAPFRLPPKKTPTADEVAGVAPALQRLERAEVAAYDALQAALAANDPLAIRAARDNWLRIGDSLRRYDAIVEQSRRDAGQLMPLVELRRCFSLLQLGVRLTLRSRGIHIANDTLIAGVLPLLANEEDKWLHDQIRKDTAGWVAQSDNHTTRAMILYAECMAYVRGQDVSDAATVNRITTRALIKSKDLPPILAKAEYEEKAYRAILAKNQ